MIKQINLNELKIRLYNPKTKNFNIVNIKDSYHYKYLTGQKQEYIDNLFLCNEKNGEAAEIGVVRFDTLFNDFKNKTRIYPDTDENLIKINSENIIIDGCHRASILFYLGIQTIKVLKI